MGPAVSRPDDGATVSLDLVATNSLQWGRPISRPDLRGEATLLTVPICVLQWGRPFHGRITRHPW